MEIDMETEIPDNEDFAEPETAATPMATDSNPPPKDIVMALRCEGTSSSHHVNSNNIAKAEVRPSSSETLISNERMETSPNSIPRVDGWEAARAWLMTLPRRRNVDQSEIEEWLQANKNTLSKEIVTMPRMHLYRYLVSQHKLIRKADQQPDCPQLKMDMSKWLEPPTARFKRSDKWKPIYSWLESLNVHGVVKTKAIDEWLSQNPEIKDELQSKHSRYHLIHYIQKCHTKILKKKERTFQTTGGPSGGSRKKQISVDKGSIERKKIATDKHPMNIDSQTESRKLDITVNRNDIKSDGMPHNAENLSNVSHPVFVDPTPCDMEHGQTDLSNANGFISTMKMGKDEAFKKYEILSELEGRLTALISKYKQQLAVSDLSTTGQRLTERNGIQLLEINDDTEGRLRRRSRETSQSQLDLVNQTSAGQIRSRLSAEGKLGRKRKKAKDSFDISMYAWSRCEASGVQRSQELSQDARKIDCLMKYPLNIVKCLKEQEAGLSCSLRSNSKWHVQKRKQKWSSILQGWESLEKQFEGPAALLERKSYSSWIPSWSAYTSSVAVAQPLGGTDQGVQKVLDVRFHPHGLAQLVCSSNEAPNELLLYDLIAGRATELAGHNCQIQAVEYAVGGASIVSCGANLVKVWDSTSGACLFTMGPRTGSATSTGHKRKINAMTVNDWQSCLVATSGCDGDGQLLLWNVLLGELASDINATIRQKHALLPAIDAMEFCNQNLLVCGSDSAYGGPAIVQLWDIEDTHECASFPAHELYITSLKISPAGNTLITGAGDGTIGLFDIRTCGGISRLSVGSDFEVTSVSFSNCGTYFHASSTANCTIVWDTRMIPMNHGSMPTEGPLPVTDKTLRSMKPLHCLSHGKPMPTADNAGQMPGYVDEGDQGVNDARWFRNNSVLLTASGNGSIAMWDVKLGQPCIRHISSHTRCVNTVAIAPNDEYIASGGDDQKVVLYHDTKVLSRMNWRLTHPLADIQTTMLPL